MHRSPSAVGRFVVCLMLPFVLVDSIRADDQNSQDQGALADSLLHVIDAVLEHHIAPPTRQEMLLRGCRAITSQDDLDAFGSLGRSVSELQSRDAMKAFLSDHLLAKKGQDNVEQSFINGILSAVPGGARYSRAKDYAVEQQLRENRYVGIGIALGKQGALPAMLNVIPGGPAYIAGGKSGDLMMSIDGEDAAQYSLQEVIEILRGQEGKPVKIVVRRPESDEERTLNIVRGEVPFGSVEGIKRDDEDKWVYRVGDADDIALLKLTAVRGSSARELKQAARQLHADGFRALIFDLRGASQQGDLRHAVMIADQLLGKAEIGSANSGGHQVRFDSAADQLFAGWPIAVLVSPETQGQAEWIAAALQDNKRAIIVGQPTLGVGFIEHAIELDNGDVVSRRSGILKRVGGRTLVSRSQHLGMMQPMRGVATRINARYHQHTGWHGVKPDEAVNYQQALAHAVSLLQDQLAETAAGDDAS